MVYYNEHDRKAAAWLHELMADDVIPVGDVDERSIEDVLPSDLDGYRQCHFFAGIGGWAYAMRLAEWPNERPIWTGSCPCQPFSQAGQGRGFTDERHVWPALHWLIAQCRPECVIGEQVASPSGRGWWDLVATDMEGLDYACGAARVPAASVKAPQLRDRLWWMASTEQRTAEHRYEMGSAQTDHQSTAQEWERLRPDPEYGGIADIMGGANRERCEGERLRIQSGESREAVHETGRYGEIDIMGGAHIARLSDGWTIATGAQRRNASGATEPTGQIVDWSDAVWIPCMDGKHRPIEPAVVGLDHGLSADLGYQCHEGVGVYAPLIDTGQARTMRLKGFGNAIVPQIAARFLMAVSDVIG